MSCFHLGPCKGRSCDYNAECVATREGTALCRCSEQCFTVPKSVCGSDGKTYKDECEMKKASCIKRQPIKAVDSGKCRMYIGCFCINLLILVDQQAALSRVI